MAKSGKKSTTAATEANQYDKILKENLLKALPELMFLLAGMRIANIQRQNLEMQHTKEAKADFVGIITDENANRFVLHLEFQLKNDPKMLNRMYDYRGFFRRLYPGLTVHQYVIYLGPTPPNMETEINEHNLHFRYNLVWLQDIRYQHLLNTDKPELIVLAMLADFDSTQPEQVAEQIMEQLKLHSESNLDFSRFTNQLRMLANIRNLQPLIDSIMEKISEFFVKERDPFYKEGVSVGIEVGMQKGKIEHSIEVTVALILETEFDDAFIAKVSGLSVGSVNAIRQVMTQHPTDFKKLLKAFLPKP